MSELYNDRIIDLIEIQEKHQNLEKLQKKYFLMFLRWKVINLCSFTALVLFPSPIRFFCGLISAWVA